LATRGYGAEIKIGQQPLKAVGCFIQVVVMPEPGKEFDVFHSGLIGVEFPGMKVKDEGLTLFLIDFLQSHATKPKRKEAEIAAAGYRDFPAHDERG